MPKKKNNMVNEAEQTREPQQPVTADGEPVDANGMTESQAKQMAINEQALQQIQAIDQQTRTMEQESLNKSHDTEFSPYSQGTNVAPANLGVITDKEVAEAEATLKKYQENKADVEQKLVDNENFWKMNHWRVMHNQHGKQKRFDRIEPKSAWLVNTIINKHADAMDNFPEPNIVPRAADDEATAKALSEIIPVILEQNDFEETYSQCAWEKNKNGSSCYGIYWDNDKDNGLGNVDIRPVDFMNLYWKSGITDIQESPNVFYVTMMDNDEIKARYPEINEPSSTTPITAANLYHYGESVDDTNQTAVVDWYYKRRTKTTDTMGIPQIKTVLHYCKFCNGQVIYASENDPNYAEVGWYSHGQYPFVVDTLYPIKSQLIGMGFCDLNGDDQLYIDKLRQAIMESAIANARPRVAVRTDSGINEEEYLDYDNAVIHFEGNLGEDAFRQITTSPLNNIYENVLLQQLQEMKDTSGNTAATQGQASSVTTASGIASLQEAAGKLSRDSNATSYRAFKKVIYQVIELIRQFYTEPRCFRIIGEMGEANYVTFDNSGLQPQSQGQAFGIDLGTREPIMDIVVKPQKKSAYSKETQNQTALNLYNMGFFAPNNADASLACLNMMDFDGVDKIKATVSQNGQLYQQVQMLMQVVQQAGLMPQGQATTSAGGGNAQQGGASIESSRGSLQTQAANAARESTAPRT